VVSGGLQRLDGPAELASAVPESKAPEHAVRLVDQ
jgi:hypothetical protein